MELVRAIKFAKPDASQRAVHKEITQLLSQKEACLKDIQLNDIKKVWKKAVTTTSSNSHGSGADVVKLFTVGNGTASTLANQYSQQAAKAAIKNKEGETTKGEGGQRLENYVHVYLDVPADKSGSRPHQAVIHFHVNNGSDDSDNNTASSERGEIVKIQVASAPNGTKFPMLLYNVDRTARTFIHPHDDGGYDQLFNCIVKEGFGGALGVSGGSKAYFYCRRTRILTGGPDILSIDVNSLAPSQGW
jgi:hypothetical protein